MGTCVCIRDLLDNEMVIDHHKNKLMSYKNLSNISTIENQFLCAISNIDAIPYDISVRLILRL